MPASTLRRGLIVLLLVILGVLVGVWWILRPAPNNNALAFGERAAVDTVVVSIAPEVELDFLSKDAVLDLRREAVAQYPVLVRGDYRPAERVFGQIEDGLPWWGSVGEFEFLYTREGGEGAPRGTSEESRYLINPFLLATGEIYFIEATAADGASWWWPGSYSEAIDLNNPPPYVSGCSPVQVTFYPPESRAEVVYDLRACLAGMAEPFDTTLTFSAAYFSIIAYNASDFNLNYVYPAMDESANVMVMDNADITRAIYNPQYIHRGGSCGLPTECNNMSPRVQAFDSWRINALPATLTLYFWKDTPDDLSVPEFTYLIRYE